MTASQYWYKQKEEQEKLKLKLEVMDEVKFIIQTAMDQIKNDILSAINQEINIQVNAFIEGKKVNQMDIGSFVVDEVIKQFKSKI